MAGWFLMMMNGLVMSWMVPSVMADCSQYLTNEQLDHYLDSKIIDEPELASTYMIGYTEQNKPIRVLEVSAAESLEQVPNVKFVGGIHGDEPIGTQLLISFIEHLIDGYKREERFITWLLNNTRIHILPRLNLDGFQFAVEGVCSLGPGRENSAGYDLNRAFSPSGDFVYEASAVMSWMTDQVHVLSASVNAGELVAVYPPDNKEENGGKDITTDDDVFKHLASVYAKNHKSMSKEKGCNKNDIFNNGTVSGAAWYPVKGSMQDYNYRSGTMELMLEVSCCKYPPSDQICSLWNENKLALLKLAAESCRGVRGRVTTLGSPIEGATVSILSRNMTVRTNKEGYYFRILLPGRYYIKVEAPGMKRSIKEFSVPVSDTAFLRWEVLNVDLERKSNRDSASLDNTPEEQTLSYDKGGLDPYTSTYNDSYLSSPDDNDIRVGLVKGAANKIYQNNIYFVFVIMLCKYFIVCIISGLAHTNCILSF